MSLQNIEFRSSEIIFFFTIIIIITKHNESECE